MLPAQRVVMTLGWIQDSPDIEEPIFSQGTFLWCSMV